MEVEKEKLIFSSHSIREMRIFISNSQNAGSVSEIKSNNNNNEWSIEEDKKKRRITYSFYIYQNVLWIERAKFIFLPVLYMMYSLFRGK